MSIRSSLPNSVRGYGAGYILVGVRFVDLRRRHRYADFSTDYEALAGWSRAAGLGAVYRLLI
jgi:hypothetical protein